MKAIEIIHSIIRSSSSYYIAKKSYVQENFPILEMLTKDNERRVNVSVRLFYNEFLKFMKEEVETAEFNKEYAAPCIFCIHRNSEDDVTFLEKCDKGHDLEKWYDETLDNIKAGCIDFEKGVLPDSFIDDHVEFTKSKYNEETAKGALKEFAEMCLKILKEIENENKEKID